MSEPTLKLPGTADQLLQSFPANEPDFDAQAQSIQARLAAAAGASGSGLDELLKVPDLAAEAGEPTTPSRVRGASAPKGNFAEMARKSLRKEDDRADLAKELLAATAQSRRPNAEMVERVRAAARLGPVAAATATGTPLPTSSREAALEAGLEDAPRASGVVARLEPRKPPARLDRGTIIGIAGGLVAIAACAALLLKTGESQTPTSATLAAEKATQPQPATAPRMVPAPAAEQAARAASDEGVLSPEALAAAPAAPANAAKGGAKVAAAATPAPVTVKASPAPMVSAPVVLEEDAPAPVAESKPEPLPPEPKLRPAQGHSGDVPLTPSAGAVSTALSSVRGSAQACLAGQTEAVSATVTFAADGHVLRVNAAGPSGACIQDALSKARIAPFARESFTATTTIRPP